MNIPLERFHVLLSLKCFPANIYSFKVKNKNTRKRCEICSKITIKTRERRICCRNDACCLSSAFIVNFEHISDLFLFLLLTLNK